MTPRVRLGLALGAVLLALGVAWTTTSGTAGYLTPGVTSVTNQVNLATGELDLVTQYTPGFYMAGTQGSPVPGYQAEVRVALVPAALVLGWALLQPSTRSRSAGRVVAVLLAACALWGVGHGLVRGPALALLAAALTVSVLRRQPTPPSRPDLGEALVPAGAPAPPRAGVAF